MTEPIIRIDGLGKKYRLQHAQGRAYKSLRETLARKAAALARGRLPEAGPTAEDFWALSDLSLQVQPGEVLGIIGRNGAGKSTLLKILSRITEPTTGRVELRGRVGSLLEVGTGFHPELTGRENIFLNGAILGMQRSEISRKFDQIVDFAELERFLDTPVKRYSSGMYVRLAFAVAAHLEPDILIVDEVLAVGDGPFQQKCLGKISEVSQGEGRTVLFVSHNLGAVQSLCSRGIVLDAGTLAYDGGVAEAIGSYMAHAMQPGTQDLALSRRTGTGEARIQSVRLETDEGTPCGHFRMGEALNIVVSVRFDREIQDPIFGALLLTDGGTPVCDLRSSHYGVQPGRLSGHIEYRARIESLHFYPRSYVVEPWVMDAAGLSDLDWVRNATHFVVTGAADFLPGNNIGPEQGIVYVKSSWQVSNASAAAAVARLDT